jgi:hypothetical protein
MRTTGNEQGVMNNMKRTRHMGMLLLGIWLIVTGLLLVNSIPTPDTCKSEEDAT